MFMFDRRQMLISAAIIFVLEVLTVITHATSF